MTDYFNLAMRNLAATLMAGFALWTAVSTSGAYELLRPLQLLTTIGVVTGLFLAYARPLARGMHRKDAFRFGIGLLAAGAISATTVEIIPSVFRPLNSAHMTETPKTIWDDVVGDSIGLLKTAYLLGLSAIGGNIAASGVPLRDQAKVRTAGPILPRRGASRFLRQRESRSAS